LTWTTRCANSRVDGWLPFPLFNNALTRASSAVAVCSDTSPWLATDAATTPRAADSESSHGLPSIDERVAVGDEEAVESWPASDALIPEQKATTQATVIAVVNERTKTLCTLAPTLAVQDTPRGVSPVISSSSCFRAFRPAYS
jgi:hypothetical protein